MTILETLDRLDELHLAHRDHNHGDFDYEMCNAWPEISKEMRSLLEKDVSLCCQNGNLLMEVHDLKKEIRKYREALEKINKDWFQPGPDSGVCGPCDGGQDPDFQDKHEPDCPYEIAREALGGSHG